MDAYLITHSLAGFYMLFYRYSFVCTKFSPFTDSLTKTKRKLKSDSARVRYMIFCKAMVITAAVLILEINTRIGPIQ